MTLLFMGSSGVTLDALMIPRPPRGAAELRSGHFCERIHFTSARTSASGTDALGGIGT